MTIIIGLGNPGKQYENTRHSFGFRVLDFLVGRPSLGEGGWDEKYSSKFIKLEDVILAKPQTFMNKSGEAVKEILKYYDNAQLIVIHDELDLPLGSIRVQKDISAAGHNGVQSIIDELGTKDFIRIRLGIDNPQTRGQIPGDDFVLQKFTEQEEQIVNEVLEITKTAIETLQTEGFDMAQSKFNG